LVTRFRLEACFTGIVAILQPVSNCFSIPARTILRVSRASCKAIEPH
jgi:hypothetical protein